MHRLLNHCDWDPEEVLDDVRDYVVEHLGAPEAALIVDDTGLLKKGSARPGSNGSTPIPVTGAMLCSRCWSA